MFPSLTDREVYDLSVEGLENCVAQILMLDYFESKTSAASSEWH